MILNRQEKKQAVLPFIIGGALLLSLVVFFLMPKQQRNDFPAAAPYTIIGMKEDFSFHGRQREIWWVRTVATNSKQALDTAKKAAVEIKNRTPAAVIQVWLINSTNEKDGIASVFYAPDGKGRSGEENWTWDVGLLMEG